MKQETVDAGMAEFEKTFASYDILTLIAKGRDESGQAVQRYIVYTPFWNDFYVTTRIPREGLEAYQKTLDALVRVVSDIKVNLQKMSCFEPKDSTEIAGQIVLLGKKPVPYIVSYLPLEIKDACDGLRRASVL